MKRQIVCEKCKTEHPLKQYTGEWNHSEKGKARSLLLCDLCGTEIRQREICHAQSMAPNHITYVPWEAQFIEIEIIDAEIRLAEQIKCVARELALRVNTYPKWVAAGNMKQDFADHQIACMKAVLATLVGLQARGD